ncbi:hypothetical protein BCR34DRAFT_574057 [Clohesyomyces aquaticus]|uniref:Uncharacterized protein n=1 Tax=Clohesyomyces aquaticus TaxID=1231657 RepID=A0A1Y1YX80_9PLEO|nr:hypothetical protein BCR34DRAFT_574057 [Clohesyomyces aquaticus]
MSYSMLPQNEKLHTQFVYVAVRDTVVPQSPTHHLSQRRRWDSYALIQYMTPKALTYGNLSPKVKEPVDNMH